MVDTNVVPVVDTTNADKSASHDVNYALIILMAQIADMAVQGDNLKASLSKTRLMKSQFDIQETALEASEKVLGVTANQDLSGFTKPGELQAEQALLTAQLQAVMSNQSALSQTQRSIGILYQTEVSPQFSMFQNDCDMGGAANRFFHNFKSKRS